MGSTQTILIRWITSSGVENVGSNPTDPTNIAKQLEMSVWAVRTMNKQTKNGCRCSLVERKYLILALPPDHQVNLLARSDGCILEIISNG